MANRSPRNVPDPAEQESPAAPPIPSFASLRGARRRTAMDLLMPDPPAPAPAPAPVRAPAPRPPDYADLLLLGVHVARALAGVPWRVARWSVREPARRLRRLVQ